MKRLLTLAALLTMVCTVAQAYSFKSGELCYNITGTNTVAVTFEKNTDASSYTASYPNLGGDLVIPETVYYGGKAYTVTAVTNFAFFRCDLITSISIPRTVQTIGDWAFFSTKATSLTFASGSVLSVIGQQAFDLVPITSVSIPNTVTTIGGHAFSRTQVVTGNIPTGIQNLGEGVFSSCQSLSNVSLPNGLKELPDYTFSGCKSLTKITLPSSLTRIGKYAFNYTGLTSISLPNGLTTIDANGFTNAPLTSITIPESVTTIGNGAFNGTSLTTVTIPSAVTSIGSNVFSGLRTLKSAKILNPILGADQFLGCSNLKEVTIGSRVETIVKTDVGWPFKYCSLEKVTIGSNSALNCYEYLSHNKATVKTVTVENTVTAIPENAFLDFKCLESISIPSTITSIGNSAFSGCTGLREFYSLMPRPLTINPNVFQDVPVDGTCDLHVPEGSKVRYENKAVWKNFVMIFEDAGSGGGGGGSGSGVRGDVTGDGTVDVEDLNAVVNIMLGKD